MARGVGQSAALANSAQWAQCAVALAGIMPGDRVLVLGGTGGVGTVCVQLAKQAGAFVAATSSDVALLTELGVDRPIDYRAEEWSAAADLRAAPLDAVIDLAEGYASYLRAARAGVLKPRTRGGRWVAAVWNDWHISAQVRLRPRPARAPSRARARPRTGR